MPSVPDVELRHQGAGKWLMAFEVACVAMALALVLWQGWRIWHSPLVGHWATWLAVPLAWLAADFASGVVHWLADTWGREDFPFWGPRFLRPFRIHHVTPRSFLECNFWNTNGDTCLVCLPILGGALFLPMDHLATAIAGVFLTSMALFGAATNQIHQWAHHPRPPTWVRWMQRAGLILSIEKHALHHQDPHVSHYCITSGACNAALERLRFFRRLEVLIQRATGCVPRSDEKAHLSRLAATRQVTSPRESTT